MVFMPAGSQFTGFRCEGINNGSIIDLRAEDITYNWNCIINTPQEPGRFIGSPHNYRLPKSDYLGHQAPSITVTGRVISGDTTSNRVSLEVLGSLARAGSVIYFWDKTTEQFTGEGSLACRINSVTYTRTPDTWSGDFGYVKTYNMNLVETRDHNLWGGL